MCGHTSRVSIFLYWSVNMYLCQCHAGLKNVIVYYILKSDSVRLLALFFFFSGLACFFFFFVIPTNFLVQWKSVGISIGITSINCLGQYTYFNDTAFLVSLWNIVSFLCILFSLFHWWFIFYWRDIGINSLNVISCGPSPFCCCCLF